MNDRHEMIEKIAEEITRRGLSVPAIFFFEMNKPLSGIFREAVFFAAPLIFSIVGSKLYKDALSIVGSVEGIEALIKEIETREALRGS